MNPGNNGPRVLRRLSVEYDYEGHQMQGTKFVSVEQSTRIRQKAAPPMVATTIGIYFVPVKKLVARSKVGEGESCTPQEGEES
jgi:hypothetical protein